MLIRTKLSHQNGLSWRRCLCFNRRWRWRNWNHIFGKVTGESVQIAFVDQGYTGDEPAQAKRSFVPLPKRWVVEHSFAWAARVRRHARDYERLPETLAGLHFVAFAMLMAHNFVHLLAQSA